MAPSSAANRVYGAANTGAEWNALTIRRSSGTLSVDTTSVGTSAYQGQNIIATPDDRNLFLAANIFNGIVSFSVDADGNSTLVSSFDETSNMSGSVMAVSPDKKFLWASGNAPEIITYQINSDGSLSRISTTSTGLTGTVEGIVVRTKTEEDP